MRQVHHIGDELTKDRLVQPEKAPHLRHRFGGSRAGLSRQYIGGVAGQQMQQEET